jgi:hypothetical protein
MADSGFLYGITYDYYPPFGNPNPEFVKVNAADGALVYKVVSPCLRLPAAAARRTALRDGRRRRVVAFRESDGAWNGPLPSPISLSAITGASADRLYATAGGTLKVLDPATARS